MNKQDSRNACEEYNKLSRRQFVGATTFAAIAASLGVSWLPRVAFAQTASKRNVVVTIFLRGGADPLSLVPPYGDPTYYSLRSTIALPPASVKGSSSCLDLNGYFGLHYAMTGMHQAYADGKMAVVVATGAQNWTRSHFDGQAWMEYSTPSRTSADGWMARHLNSVPPAVPGSLVRGISVTPGLPRTLESAPQTLPIPNIGSVGFPTSFYGSDGTVVEPWMRRQYDLAGDPTTVIFRNVQATYNTLQKVGFNSYNPTGTTYGTDVTAMRLKSAACLIKAAVGIEAIHIDVDGWDTHAQQGTVQGAFAGLAQSLSDALGSFYIDMQSSPNTTYTVVVMTEFGRAARENDSAGTDHGTGSAMFVMGNGVKGGQVYGQWPGLSNLYQNVDLQATTDYRNVLAEVLVKAAAETSVGTVFPGLNYAPVGFMS